MALFCSSCGKDFEQVQKIVVVKYCYHCGANVKQKNTKKSFDFDSLICRGINCMNIIKDGDFCCAKCCEIYRQMVDDH